MIEDNPADVQLVREAMDEHAVDCELSLFNDGAKAIALFDQVDSSVGLCPDLIVLDLNLPKRTGLEVLQRIRASPVCSAIPVMVLSSSDAANDKNAALRFGANLYVRKPSNLEEFLKIGGAVKRLLGDSDSKA